MLTLDEICAMDDRKLDAAVAEQAMGWSEVREEVRSLLGIPPEYKKHGTSMDVPHYATRLDACHAAEERLKEMGVLCEWLAALEEVSSQAQDADLARYPWKWYMIHASARQRAEAILMAVQEKKNK